MNTKLIERSIHEKLNYGKVEIKLSSIMNENNITKYKMSKLADLKYCTVKSYYNNCPLTRVDLDVICKLCYVLNCKIEDILEYIRPN